MTPAPRQVTPARRATPAPAGRGRVLTAGVRRPSPARRGHLAWSWPGAVATVAVAAAASTFVLPGAAGLSGRWPWAALIAFRGVLLLAAGAATLVLGVATLVSWRWRRVHTALLVLTVLAAAAGAGELAVLTERGLGSTPPTAAARPGELTVVVSNTDVSRADPGGLTRLFLAADADVLAMPETDTGLAAAVAARLAAAGRPVQVFGVAGQGSILPTALLVWTGLGRYRQVGADGGGLGAVVADPVGAPAGRPVLVAVHPMAPLTREFLPVWRSGTTRAVALCRDGADTVVAGDFNSTDDHPALRSLGRCFDAAQQAGAAGVATWPAWVPEIVGAPLDHVVADGTRWRPVAVWIQPVTGSDHRSLVARLAPQPVGGAARATTGGTPGG